ncbi:MAG: hypothetical protein R3D31_11135 [Hyphomicrobiaceae bacterium]
MKRFLLPLLSLVVAVGLMVTAADAAPVGSTLPSISGIAADGSVVEKVHGCHRRCAPGPRGHVHRHAGPNCVRVSCGRPGYRPRRQCNKDWHCEKTGPLGLSKRCYWRTLCN